MRHLEGQLQIAQSGGPQIDQGPALATPGIVDWREDIWRELAFESLLIRREPDICGEAIGSQCHIDAIDLECGAVEVRRLCRAGQGKSHASKVCRIRHGCTFSSNRHVDSISAPAIKKRGTRPR